MSYPFSENEIAVIGPECPGKFATLPLSFKSQILITLENINHMLNRDYLPDTAYWTKIRKSCSTNLSVVPVPKISPSGWNCAHVSPEVQKVRFNSKQHTKQKECFKSFTEQTSLDKGR